MEALAALPALRGLGVESKLAIGQMQVLAQPLKEHTELKVIAQKLSSKLCALWERFGRDNTGETSSTTKLSTPKEGSKYGRLPRLSRHYNLNIEPSNRSVTTTTW